MKSLENKMREEIKRELGVKCGKPEDELKLLEFDYGKLRENLETQSKLLDEKTKEFETKLVQQEQKNNDSIKMANQNEQYSRKNNIKIMNIEEGPGEDEEKLTTKVCTILQHQGVELLKEEIMAIHRLPTKSMSHKPVIIKTINNNVKAKIMRKRKEMKSVGFRIADDVTRLNTSLINRLNGHEKIDSSSI